MRTVLISGGAGFIGSHLCRKLLSENFHVICVDNLITGDKKNIADLMPNPEFTFLEKDVVTDPIDEACNYVFHLASPASPNQNSPRSYIHKPIETLDVNAIGTKNLLELARKHQAKFLFTSTSEVYGDPAVSPQAETYWGNVNPVGVRSVYDEAKRYGEALTMAYHRVFQLDTRIVRIFNTYGPSMQPDDGRVVSNFITQALGNNPLTVYGDGNQTRSLCFVSDMVEGITKAMFAEGANGEVINLGNSDERTILKLATIIKELVGSTSEIVHEKLPSDDPKVRNPDISKAKKLLSWEPTVSLEEGLKKTIEYFRTI